MTQQESLQKLNAKLKFYCDNRIATVFETIVRWSSMPEEQVKKEFIKWANRKTYFYSDQRAWAEARFDKALSSINKIMVDPYAAFEYWRRKNYSYCNESNVMMRVLEVEQ